jgi:predicted transcriptional regulator
MEPEYIEIKITKLCKKKRNLLFLLKEKTKSCEEGVISYIILFSKEIILLFFLIKWLYIGECQLCAACVN